MKRKLALGAVIAICLSLAAYGSVAYFTTEDTAHNVITTCGVNIELTESPDSDSPGNPTQTAEGGLEFTGVMPGMTIKKEPKIKNLEQPVWVRVRIDKSWDNTDSALNLSADVIGIVIDGDMWLENTPDDGWLYYRDIVGTGEEILPFAEVTFSGPEMGNEYQGQKGRITVIVQAVQSVHNHEGDGVLKAVGWPDE